MQRILCWTRWFLTWCRRLHSICEASTRSLRPTLDLWGPHSICEARFDDRFDDHVGHRSVRPALDPWGLHSIYEARTRSVRPIYHWQHASHLLYNYLYIVAKQNVQLLFIVTQLQLKLVLAYFIECSIYRAIKAVQCTVTQLRTYSPWDIESVNNIPWLSSSCTKEE